MTPARVSAAGKFLSADGEKLLLRGVTYGGFRVAHHGVEFPERARADQDFAAMASAGVNSVRLYTVPPEWLLDAAAEHGLRLLVGLPWESHVTFLDSRSTIRSIRTRVRDGVRACAGHPAVLGYAVGNEIPAPIARWHGRRGVERFIEDLYEVAKAEDADAPVTYVNYPTTEYLQLPFLDFVAFNVFLEQREALESYAARLHALAGDRPLVLTELGLDSRRHGERTQADSVEWQLRAAYESGCAGAFAFSWTDEWHRGGHDVEDWDFGLVTRDRRPKPALAAASRVFASVWGEGHAWPKFSVVVCTHNGERWLPGCLDAIGGLDYPDYEVIVVDDGSTDRTREIASAAGAKLVRSDENLGLSAARNLGASAARGEVVAFIDDDARPDRHWLSHLALAFERGYAAVGGPNIPPPGSGAVAETVAGSPGGPIHVLLSDQEAEHVPGCNMAVRTSVLREISGFDARFRIAGDDVDFCWRVQQAGHAIGFSHGAMVWHHRRGSVGGYLRQQYEYGKAEALLEAKWPRRYNRFGHVTWSGSVYGGNRLSGGGRRGRPQYGSWGSRLFQSIYSPAPGPFYALALMPEWHLVALVLALVSALGVFWTPLFLALPLLTLVTLVVAARGLVAVAEWRPRGSWLTRLRSRSLLMVLFILQPPARLAARLRNGLSPWRRRCVRVFATPRAHTTDIWTDQWMTLDDRIAAVEARLECNCHTSIRGGDWDRWDLQARGGMFAVARLLGTAEEHGAGRQFVRFRVWPRASRGATAIGGVIAVLAASAAVAGAGAAAVILGLVALTVAGAIAYDCALSVGLMVRAVDEGAGRRVAEDGMAADVVELDRQRPVTRAHPDRDRGANGAGSTAEPADAAPTRSAGS